MTNVQFYSVMAPVVFAGAMAMLGYIVIVF